MRDCRPVCRMKRGKGQDIVKRHLFPIKAIVELGRIQQACDFIGNKVHRGIPGAGFGVPVKNG